MRDELSSVCPIFIRNSDDKIEHIGSGVLLELENNIFLLTAAHVIDWSEKGKFCIPCKDSISPITGYLSSMYAPKSIDRSKDKIDIAYFKLDEDLTAKIHDSFSPITREECWLTDNAIEDDVYSFSGWPISKTKERKKEISSEFYSYSGVATNHETYNKLGYDPDTNIIISFNRKKSVYANGQKLMPPHPKGVSGGAVFRWPKSFNDKDDRLKRHLVGIGHTYLKREKIFIGTKLEIYLNFISLRNPSVNNLAGDINFSRGDNSIPLFVALVYYRREEWSLLISQFEDAQNMHKSWHEWRDAVEAGLEHMHKHGKVMIPIELFAKEIEDYCKENNLPNIGRTRIRIANIRLNQLIREMEIIKEI